MSRFNHLEFGNNSRSEGEQRLAVTKDAGYYETAANLAFQTGHFDDALRSFAKILEYNPREPKAWSGQIRCLIELREYTEANVWADKALETFPEEPEVLSAKAVALARLGDLKAALSYSDNAVEAGNPTPYVWLARGDVLLAKKEQRAEYCFEKALGLGASDWLTPWLAARIQSFYCRFASALKLLQQAISLNPGSAMVWLEMGRCQGALGLVGLAEHSFTQAQHLDPACPGLNTAWTQLSQTGPIQRFRAALARLFRR